MPTFTPHPYQREAIDFLLSRLYLDDEIGASLQLDPGLGKTAISLQTIYELRQAGMARRVLISAPLRVIYSVWPAEIRKWRYPFTWSVIHGSNKRNALLKPADIYLINREGIPWLELQYPARFDMLINDESTSFKSWSAKRTKALRKLCKRIPKRVNLTGTPAPNGEEDWFAQQFIADDGAALGKTITYFRDWAMRIDPYSYQGRKYVMSDAAVDEFYKRIAPSVLCMRCEDHLDMPPKVDNLIRVELPPLIRTAYRQVERSLFAELENGDTLTASGAGAKYTLCRQIANGGAYQTDDFGTRHDLYVHDAKIEAVKELLSELNGKPLLLAYQFDHDRERLQKALRRPPAIKGGMKAKDSQQILDDWNEGKLPLLLVQPQALSHGVNMQAGGRDLCWFGHTDQLEIFLQLNARLWRQGQTGQVRYHHILAADTVDEAVYERLQDKHGRQDAMINALKAYRAKRVTEELNHVATH